MVIRATHFRKLSTYDDSGCCVAMILASSSTEQLQRQHGNGMQGRRFLWATHAVDFILTTELSIPTHVVDVKWLKKCRLMDADSRNIRPSYFTSGS